MGKGEGEERKAKCNRDAQEANAIGNGSEKNCNRATCSLGKGQSGKEGSQSLAKQCGASKTPARDNSGGISLFSSTDGNESLRFRLGRSADSVLQNGRQWPLSLLIRLCVTRHAASSRSLSEAIRLASLLLLENK